MLRAEVHRVAQRTYRERQGIELRVEGMSDLQEGEDVWVIPCTDLQAARTMGVADCEAELLTMTDDEYREMRETWSDYDLSGGRLTKLSEYQGMVLALRELRTA